MSEEFGIGPDELRGLIGGILIFVDIRDEDNVDTEGRIKDAFEIEEYDLPNHVSAVPMYFRTANCVIICETGEVARKWVETYRSQDDDVQLLRYYIGGSTALFEEIPELKS